MADDKPTAVFYKNLGGINNKASEYSIDKAQFLSIYNMDFDVPNALSKRPGSTQAIGANASGPINSLFEFVKLTGESYIVAGTDTAMFYMSGASLNLLDAGWTNGQPTDMLTFVNKLWMANGQKYKYWAAGGSLPLPAGLPCPKYNRTTHPPNSGGLWACNPAGGEGGGATHFLVGGATYLVTNASYLTRSVFVGYSYVRGDSYIGPIDFQTQAFNVVSTGASPGADFFNLFPKVFGFTCPSGYGISAIAIWVAVDSIFKSSPGSAGFQVGNLSYLFVAGEEPSYYNGASMRPDVDDPSRYFYLKSIVPASSLFLGSSFGFTAWGTTFLFGGSLFNSYTGFATGEDRFQSTPFCWFETNTPKYIEQNNNSMFMAGFSNAPSTVWFSNLGEPEVIEPESNIEVRTNDGDRILAIRAFNNSLIVMKQNSFHKILGDSPENFELVELSGEYGCISNHTVMEYKEKLCWLDQKGILEFNGSGWDIISTPVEDMFRRMNLSAAREHAVGFHNLYRNQLWWGIPIDGSTKNNLTVVYDYLVGAWTYFDGFNPSAFALMQGPLNKPTAWRGDYSGMIYYHGESFFGDNGQGITCLMTPHWDKNKENETWIWRRFFLDVATATGLTGTITGRLFSDYNQSTVMATLAMTQNAFQSRAEVGVMGKAVTGEFAHHSASLPLLINGYSWAKRFLRNV